MQTTDASLPAVRIDKWLWAARFFKTRTLAQDEIHKGRIAVNGLAAKASRELHVGDVVSINSRQLKIVVSVQRLSEHRGAAPFAQTLYEETPESRVSREQARAAARAQWAQQETDGQRPTKRDRRRRDAFEEAPPHSRESSQGWGSRWSAEVD